MKCPSCLVPMAVYGSAGVSSCPRCGMSADQISPSRGLVGAPSDLKPVKVPKGRPVVKSVRADTRPPVDVVPVEPVKVKRGRGKPIPAEGSLHVPSRKSRKPGASS